ncbi:MAG: hypothetical protein LKE54_03595 [Prevotella sp.]|jgi:hypothetical protein|nr:hypothetical protein [Prevotella sp.]MCH3994130.1 hypothetical protein [Prevotella sp.]
MKKEFNRELGFSVNGKGLDYLYKKLENENKPYEMNVNKIKQKRRYITLRFKRESEYHFAEIADKARAYDDHQR